MLSSSILNRSMSTVGIVGVGKMGAAIASNLVEAGHSVHLYDVNEEVSWKRSVCFRASVWSDALVPSILPR
jgi:3-hydroxyisobutyrate dehydrogenase-like beta-hydroxyacid dehydrogenase